MGFNPSMMSDEGDSPGAAGLSAPNPVLMRPKATTALMRGSCMFIERFLL